MSNYAVIRDGVVENIIVLDEVEQWPIPEGASITKVNDGAFLDIGYLYDGETFAAPADELGAA